MVKNKGFTHIKGSKGIELCRISQGTELKIRYGETRMVNNELTYNSMEVDSCLF